MRLGRSRRQPSVKALLIASATFTAISLLILTLRSLDDSSSTNGIDLHFRFTTAQRQTTGADKRRKTERNKGCATVEEMGDASFHGGGFREQSLRVRRLIQNHFTLNGASRIRDLPSEEFCRHGYVIAKASEAGFGNEMYKILTAAALSLMLNRSLIIGQTRHIGINILLGITSLIRTLPSP